MSGGSALRNAVKRITHKERDQPSDRKKLGHLEKHKDYKVRAIDFQNKKKYITSLKRKAADRNPDEFYHKMHSSQVIGGTHKETKSNTIDIETSLLLKSQDTGYLVYKKSIEDRKISKLMANLHFIGAAPKKLNNHKVFISSDASKASTLIDRTSNSVDELYLDDFKLNDGESGLDSEPAQASGNTSLTLKDIKSTSSKISSQYNELKSRCKRAKQIDSALQQLTLQRQVMGKGTKRKIEVDGKVIYKWKRQRSK